MALIIDIETTGLPIQQAYDIYYPYYNIEKYNTSRIVQFSMMYCDEEFNILEEVKDYIIKADKFSINNSEFHGIGNELSQNSGIPIQEVMNVFMEYLQKCKYVISHNSDFDISVIKSELFRYGMMYIIAELETKVVYCSMKDTVNLVKAVTEYGQIKYPSLKELYKFVVGYDIMNQHNSKYDVINFHRILKRMYEMKMIRLSD